MEGVERYGWTRGERAFNVSPCGPWVRYSDYEQVVEEREKLREEQRSALASEHFASLPVAPKPGPSVVCAEGDHHECLLPNCPCDCHRRTIGEVG